MIHTHRLCLFIDWIDFLCRFVIVACHSIWWLYMMDGKVAIKGIIIAAKPLVIIFAWDGSAEAAIMTSLDIIMISAKDPSVSNGSRCSLLNLNVTLVSDFGLFSIRCLSSYISGFLWAIKRYQTIINAGLIKMVSRLIIGRHHYYYIFGIILLLPSNSLSGGQMSDTTYEEK